MAIISAVGNWMTLKKVYVMLLYFGLNENSETNYKRRFLYNFTETFPLYWELSNLFGF